MTAATIHCAECGADIAGLLDYEAHARMHETEPDRYNGWKNRETWCVNLWLSSDTPELYQEARDAAWQLVAEGHHPDHFREFVEAYVFGDEAPASLGTDLIMGALSVVDWHAVVDALTEA